MRTTGTLSLPPSSPKSSPPASPASTRGPRVTWSLPSHSMRGSIPSVHTPERDDSHNKTPEIDPSSSEFIAWRRLHLSHAKLDGITEMAALMAGFSVVATVELQINDDANPPLLATFTVVTALLVCSTMLAIMISTCILPHITVVADLHQYSKPSESPHERMAFYIDLSWVLANTVSIFLFTLDVILLCWIKFTYFSVAASWCATAIMIPVLFAVCIFGIVFYRKLVKHQYLLSDKKYQELEEMKRQLDSASAILHV